MTSATMGERVCRICGHTKFAAACAGGALMMASCSLGAPEYVGEAGVLREAGGDYEVFVNPCGEAIIEVSVEAGGDTVGKLKASEPSEEPFSFVLGGRAPAPWQAADLGDIGIGADDEITVSVELADASGNREFTPTEIAVDEFDRPVGNRIFVGTPHKSGDRTLSDPESWLGVCRE